MKVTIQSRRFVAVGLALVALVYVSTVPAGASSRTAKSTSNYTFELVNGNNTDPYFITMWDGAAAEAKKLNVKLIENAPADTDSDAQASLVNDAIANHVSAIIISALSAPPLIASLKAAKAAHIPVIITNASVADMDNTHNALSFITASNTALGYSAGQEMARLVGNRSVSVGIINYQPGVEATDQRGSGFVSAMKKYAPKVTLLPVQYDTTSTATLADSLATDMITANSDLAGIYTINTYMGQGVGTAVEAAGKTGSIKVVSIDAEPEEVTLLKQGVIQALIAQRPFNVGSLAVEYALDALTGHTSKIVRNVNAGEVVLTQANINTKAGKAAIYSPTKP